MAAACRFEPNMNSSKKQWYALKVQSRMAKLASMTLRAKGFEEYLPVYRSRRRWSDRTKELEIPLFPGYLFCRFDPFDRLVPVLTTPGVTGLVSAGKTPIPVPESEIDSVRMLLRSGLEAQPWPYLPVGTKILITNGPLAGVEGIITDANDVERLVVSITLLQRSLAVVIDRAWAAAAA